MWSRRIVPWLSLSLWTAGLLSIVRCTAALLNEEFGLETEVEMAFWRLTPSLWEHAFFALAVSMVLSAWTRFIVELNAIIWLKLAFPLAAAVPPCFYIVRGWSHAVLPDPVDPYSPYLPEAFQYLGMAAIGVAVAHTLIGLVTHLIPGNESHFGRWTGVFSGLLLFLAAPVLLGAWGRSTPPTRNYMQPGPSLLDVVADVLDRPGDPPAADPQREYEVEGDSPVRSWWLDTRHAEFPPTVGTIQPLRTPLADGASIRSLIMPPPCQVRFMLDKDAPPVLLRAAAGVDQSYTDEARVSFYVEVNPQRDLATPKAYNGSVQTNVASDRLRGWQRARLQRYMMQEPEYQDLVQVDGIPLEPGDTVVLRTKYHKPIGMRSEDVPYIPAGFGELRLDTRVEKKRQRPSLAEPNVVWIVLDSLRADRMSCYGYRGHEWPATPNLDALAARGLLYENAYATSSDTRSSTASLLTGRDPLDHGFFGDGAFLDNRLRTLAESLSGRSYWTVAFSCNPWVAASRNLGQGFDEFDDLDKYRAIHRVEGDVREWIEDNVTTRFFLYLHLSETHPPYRIVPELRERHELELPHDYPRNGIEGFHEQLLDFATGRSKKPVRIKKPHRDWIQEHYDMAVETADYYVERVLGFLEENELLDSTIVVVTGSHGEELLDHGLTMHGHALWEGLVHVPLILAGPGVPVGRVATPVSTRHVASTLARRVGAELPGADEPLDLLAPDALPERPVFFSTASGLWGDLYPVQLYGVRDGDWVLHLAAEPASLPPESRVHLYDLATDPGQTTDRAADEPERARAMIQLLQEHLERYDRSASEEEEETPRTSQAEASPSTPPATPPAMSAGAGERRRRRAAGDSTVPAPDR